MLKRGTWPAYLASLAGAMLMGAVLTGPPGASAASAGRPGRPAGHVMVPVGAAPGFPGGQDHRPGRQLGHPAYHRGAALRSPPRPAPPGHPVSTPGSSGFRHFLTRARSRPASVRGGAPPPRSGPGCTAITSAPGRPWGMACCCPPPDRWRASRQRSARRSSGCGSRTAGRRCSTGGPRGCPLICAARCPPSSASALCTCRVRPRVRTRSRAPGLPRGPHHPARLHGGLAGPRLQVQSPLPPA